uniref:ATP synthase F0 subunit 8 n=1 Tax=Atkinsoniella wui TaxID=2930062 RepID=UPI002001696B|nr:ATP synthase F0 subunit 8 [Atkinsoniella wui]UNZ12655.1 ATP synthase F0 subunit 8 [Atkinsoniella wui]
MPQMAPMWWTSLMLTFMLSFLLMMSLLYFNTMSNSMMMKQNKTVQMNWKW